MNTLRLLRSKPAIMTLAFALLAFASAPQAPLGQVLWPAPVELVPGPTAAQTGLFMLLGVVTALAFGGGVAFLVYGRPAVRRLFGPERPGIAVATHLAVFWILWNWWVHDSLHMVVGMHAGRLLAIEYAFHVTLMAAGAVLVYALLTVSSSRAASPAR